MDRILSGRRWRRWIWNGHRKPSTCWIHAKINISSQSTSREPKAYRFLAAAWAISGDLRWRREPMKKLILAVLMFAFGYSASFAAESKKIVFAYSSIGPMATGIWMAKESGAFEKYGLQGDIILITSGPVATQSLIGGDLQLVSAASNAVVNA